MAETINQSSTGYGIAPPGYRLPAATRIGRVRLQIADLVRSVSYYEQVVGFRTLSRTSDHATLGAHGDDTPLLELHENRSARPVPRRGRIGLFHFAILLPDRPSLARFVVHLAKIGARAGMSDHLVSEAIYLTDPDGLGIEVYADRPRASWRHAGGQIEMATNPLDVEDLVAVAKGEPWTGLPPGTRIGHVHLHVMDLPGASAFYHDALGFDKVVWNYPGALFLSAGGYHHHLGTNIWAAHAPPASENDAKLIEWEIVVPRESDVAAVEASVRQGGVGADREGSTVLLRDPWGTAVRVRAET